MGYSSNQRKKIIKMTINSIHNRLILFMTLFLKLLKYFVLYELSLSESIYIPFLDTRKLITNDVVIEKVIFYDLELSEFFVADWTVVSTIFNDFV